MSEIAVIGAGAWGTALSIVAARRGNHRVRLWAYEPEVRESVPSNAKTSLFLPGQLIPETVRRHRRFRGSPGRRANCHQRDAVEPLPASVRKHASLATAGNVVRKRNQGAGGTIAAAHDRSDCAGRGNGFRAATRSAQWSIVRQRSGARGSHRCHDRVS